MRQNHGPAASVIYVVAKFWKLLEKQHRNVIYYDCYLLFASQVVYVRVVLPKEKKFEEGGGKM